MFQTSDINATGFGIFEAAYDDDNRLWMHFNSTNTRLYGLYQAVGANDNALISGVANNSWIDVAYSWDRPNGDHGVYYSSWTGATHDDEIGALTFASDVTQIIMGNLYYGSTITAGTVYVTQWAITSDYQGSKPW